MASPRSAWGIDIGNRALKAVKLTRDGDSIRVEDFDFIEHETILSQAGDNRDDLIRHALATFVGRKSTKGAAVAVGVSGQTSFARFIKLPPVEAKQIPQIVKFEAIQQIPFPLDEVEWAYQLFQTPDSPDIECGIFAMRKELVNDWVGLFTQNDLNVQAVQTNPLAVYNACQRDGRLADGTAMIIDVGAENTDLIIASENSIWLRSIPIGGNSFTETIMKAFKLPAAKAEDLKRDAAGSKYYRQILQAMRPVFADLVAEIQRSIGFYASVNREHKINKIIALGGTFRMPSLPKYLQQNLQLEVERPDNFAAGLPEDSKMAASLTENLLSLHAAYGLALQAMGETKVDSSLLPTAIRKRKMWQEKNKWFATAAAMCVLGLAVAAASYVISSSAFAAQGTEREKAEAIKQQATQLNTEWTEVQGSGGPELQTIKNVNALNAHRELWPNILTDIAASIPQPPADLAKAIAAGDSEAIKKTPRGQRKIIQVDQLRSIYFPDLGPVLRSTELRPFLADFANAGSSGFGGGPSSGGFIPGVEGAPPPSGQRGFLVYMKLLSPNDQVEEQLVKAEVLKRLATIAPTAAKPKAMYAFMRPEFIQSIRLFEDRDLIARIQADFQAMQTSKTQTAAPAAAPGGMGGPGMGGSPSGEGSVSGYPGGGYPGGGYPGAGYPGGAAAAGGYPGGGYPGAGGVSSGGGAPIAAGSAEAEALKDRITGEDTTRDKVVDVLFVIVLDPPDFGATPAEGAASPMAAPAAAPGIPLPTSETPSGYPPPMRVGGSTNGAP